MKPAATIVAAACALCLALAAPAEAVPGHSALVGGTAKVTGSLEIETHGLRTVVAVSMTSIVGARPVTRYAAELTKRLHLIAISGDGQAFVHEHADRPGPGGVFHIPIRFPKGGPWHIYADAVPAGLGQQVLRFDVTLGASAPAAPMGTPASTGLESHDGRYGARFDALDLRAGQVSPLVLHLLRDGMPAPDVTQFLGVAAHAVFIDTADLSYVHVHASPAGVPATHHGMGIGGMHMEQMGALAAGAKVSPELALELTPPKAGTYLMWLQFMAGGKVRTARFVIPVA